MVSITFLCALLTIVFCVFGALVALLVISNTKEIVRCTNIVNGLERKYYDKQMDCAVLTWEIDRMVKSGASTELKRDKKYGGYIT